MRKLTAISFLLLLNFPSYAQAMPDGAPTAIRSGEWYRQRARNQKTAAWLMLGGGTVLALYGLQKATNAPIIIPYGTGKEAKTGAILFFSGAGTVLGSIPLFIASARNRRKALSMNVKTETSWSGTQEGSFAALSLRLAL
jgi:hypothetical protein